MGDYNSPSTTFKGQVPDATIKRLSMIIITILDKYKQLQDLPRFNNTVRYLQMGRDKDMEINSIYGVV